MNTVSLRCACGEVRGEIDDPKSSNRVVCYCDDCQAFARFLGRDDLLDAYGGTDICQVTPSQIRITAGCERLQVMRLSERGLVRWYTACCRTPAGNMLASRRSPFVGLALRFLDLGDAAARDTALGPPIGYIQGRFAIGGCPEHVHPRASASTLWRSVRFLLRGALRGKHRPSPYFDSATGSLMAVPQVLDAKERALLYGS